jgi:hypothetical protein
MREADKPILPKPAEYSGLLHSGGQTDAVFRKDHEAFFRARVEGRKSDFIAD